MKIDAKERSAPRPAFWQLLLGMLLTVLVLAVLPAPASAAPPAAIISLPFNGSAFDAGQNIVFDGNSSFDPDDSNATLFFEWNFSGEVITGAGLAIVNYANFTLPGNYTVSLKVTDAEPLDGYANVTVVIRTPNQLPSAVIAAPSSGSRYFTDQFVNFSGTGSSDPEGGVLAYFWSTNRSGQFGTGETISVRLGAGEHRVTLTVVDDRGAGANATVDVHIEVNVPPRIDAAQVQPPAGFAADAFVFTATYFEDNGEPAVSVLLVLDGSPHPMSQTGGSDPRSGLSFASTLTLGGGRHTFYVLASDGNLTNLSASVVGPDVWTRLSLVSADGFAAATLEALAPQNVTVVAYTGPAPPDPTSRVAVSLAYRVNGSFLAAANFSLTMAFAPPADVNRTTARVHRAAANGSEWVALVTAVDAASNTASVAPAVADLPGIFRVFAARLAPPPNAPPVLVIAFRGDARPNSTMVFDGGNSTDPEGAALLLAWHFEGPGIDTGWVPGATVQIAFPAEGVYAVSLRGDDGSGNIVYRNTTVDIRAPAPPPVRDGLQEAVALAGLAVAVVVAGALSRWWRSRRPVKRSYDDLYGRAYKGGFNEEREYAQLFEKFAGPEGQGPAADDGASDPPAGRP